MTNDPEQTVDDSIRYLRDVRPIDPEEIARYVSDELSSDEVRDLISERAVELRLIERDDGRFEAASTEPVTVDFGGVSALPAGIQDRIESSLEAAYGEHWATGESGDELRRAIRAFKRAYLNRETVDYIGPTALGYAIYHLPQSFASIQYVIDELAQAKLLDSTLRILDIGAGVGGQALGLDAYVPQSTFVEYTAIEPSHAATELLRSYLGETGPNVHVDIRRSSIEEATIDGSFDIILCSNVLNEIERPTPVLERLRSHLGPTGSVVLIEPADKETSRGLRRIEREVCSNTDLSVFSPALRLWPGREPFDDCWSFDRQADLAVPAFQDALDHGPSSDVSDRQPATGEFVNVDVQYSYSILRRDDERRIEYHPPSRRYEPLASAGQHITERINVAVVKLSQSLADDPQDNELFVIGDGSQNERWFAVLTQRSRLNRFLRTAEYGDILLIEHGLALWNDDEEAVNLVVDDETVIDRVTPEGIHHA